MRAARNDALYGRTLSSLQGCIGATGIHPTRSQLYSQGQETVEAATQWQDVKELVNRDLI